MSIKSWLEEFYPEEAQSIEEDRFHADRQTSGPKYKGYTKESLLIFADAAIQKWKGKYKKNLDKHNLEMTDSYTIVEKDGGDHPLRGIWEGESCTYCEAFTCSDCPLQKVNAVCGNIDSPYGKAVYYGETRKLVNALQKSRKWIEENFEKVADKG